MPQFRAVILKLKNCRNMPRVVVIKDNSNYFNDLKIPTIIIAGGFSVSIFDSPTPFKSNHEKF